nr:MAG TPA: tail protein [Caudoviricetes sp.]
MINVSDTFKQKLQDGERTWQEVEITFPDGTVKTVKDEIMGENCTFSDCAESSSFPIGCVVCKSMTLELDNTSDQWKNYNFYMAKVHAYLKMQTSVASPAATDELLDENYEPILDQSGGAILATKAATEDRIETIDKGIYTITTPEQYGEILNLTALDDMYKTNAVHSTKLVLPQTVESLVRDACSTLGITAGFSKMAHGDLIINELPKDMTYRQLFGWAAMLDTANARLDSNGSLQFVGWNLDATPSIELKDYISMPAVSSDDIVITGINIISGDNSGTYGTSGYILSMENNLVGESDLVTVAAQIGDSIIGTKFRNLQGDMAFNPLLEFGDVAYTYDRNLNQYVTPLTDVSCTVNGKTTLKTQADDPIRGMSLYYSGATKAIVAARRLVEKEKNARELAIKKLQESLSVGSGLFATYVQQEDGSTISYFHDKGTLEESKNVIKITSEAIGVSNDGGNTYPFGFQLTGTMITKLLYAEGINANYIDTGALTVRDKDGNIIFQVDMDTKTVVIDPDVLIIGNMTLSEKLENMDENIASAKNMTFQLSNDMQTITSDADGNIPVFPTVTTTAKVMYGSSDITNDCSYTVTKSDSVTGSWDVDTHTYTVTGLSADNGWVDIKATYLINLSVTKRFTISKQKSGKNGKQLYTWRKYASMPDGSDMSDSPDYVKLLDSAESPILDSTGDEIYTVTEAIYVGIADNKTTETPSDNPKDYIWSRFRGEDGADGIGIPGENGETSYIHTAYANSIDGTVDFSTTDTDRIYIGHYSDFEKTDSADPAKYTWARMRGEDGPPGRTYYLRANAGVLMMGQDKKITPNPFKVHAYYRDGQGDEATFKTWWVVEYSKDSGKTWTKLAFNVQTSGITINPDSYSLGADGMIRATIYTDSGRTKIADQQTWQVAVDVGMLTQEQIVEILSNGGEFKGLYYLNGHLYISLDALMGNAAILGGTKNGNGYLKIKDKKGTVKGLIDYSGYTAFTSYEENSTRMKYTGICFSDTGINPVSAEKYFSSTADIEYVETAWGIDWTAEELNISATEVSADTGTFGDLTVTNSASFAKSPKIENMEYTTSSNTICWDGRTGYKQLMLKSSSSKRYKDIGNDISEQEIENWYNIEPTWAKYKEGYLVEGDENEGRYIPMFIAENVEAFFPEATRYQNGLVEDWNERIMIPAMFAMIKSQKKQLDRQEKLINQLYKKLNIEKEN